jgi:hypothetical protein
MIETDDPMTFSNLMCSTTDDVGLYEKKKLKQTLLNYALIYEGLLSPNRPAK